MHDVGGTGAPSPDELVLRVQMQAVPASDGLISSATVGPTILTWLTIHKTERQLPRI
jgi:hypothetical protein